MLTLQCPKWCRNLFYISVFFLCFRGQAQTNNYDQIIAEGASKLKVRPDMAIFTFSVEKIDTVEQEVTRSLNREVMQLTKSLSKLGFPDNMIKIADYRISSSSDDNDKRKYTASNTLKIEFNINTSLIDAIYKEVETAGLSDLDVGFDTRISDSLEKKIRMQLVSLAVADAGKNAANIAKSLQVKLLKVKQVLKYTGSLYNQPATTGLIKFTPPKLIGATKLIYSTPFDKFQVDEIDLEEKVTIVYEISN